MVTHGDRREIRVLSPKPPGPATLTFARNQQHQFKERTIAVAWQAVQHGGYEGDNVTAMLTRDLHRAGFKVDQTLVRRSMDWLELNSWATQVIAGRRTTLFMVDPDVTVPEPTFVAAKRMKARAAEARPQPPGVVVSDGFRRPPLPGDRSQADPPWLGELTVKLRQWHRGDPAAAEAWAREALQCLQ